VRIGAVDLDREVLVVAEIGNNHEGDVGLAEELVGLAAAAGAQAVKFQTIVPERLVGPDPELRLASHFRRYSKLPWASQMMRFDAETYLPEGFVSMPSVPAVVDGPMAVGQVPFWA